MLDVNLQQIGFFVFVFILGMVFFALIASVCYLFKKLEMCLRPREVRRNKNVLYYNNPALTCGSSTNAIVITTSDEDPPPSYEMATGFIGHRY